MNETSVDRSELGWFWWSASAAAALGAAWLLLQVLAIVFGNNAPQVAILLGVSLVIVGAPTFLVAICTLIYAARQKPSASVHSRQWRAGIALSAVNVVIPLVAG